MDLNNINEQSPKPVIARKKGQLGAVLMDPKTGKPIPDTWVSKAEVPQKALKYLDPSKFAAAEKRNKDRQAQIDANRERLKGVGLPSTTPPASPSGGSGTTTPKPPVASAPTRRPAPVAAPSASQTGNKVVDMATWAKANPRLAQASTLRQQGAPRADINRVLYNKGTAAYGASGKSEMEKQTGELKDLGKKLKKDMSPGTGPQAKSSLPGGNYSASATAKMTPRTKTMLGLKDSYDIVLDYLFSQGHVDTLEEALYVMMEMDSKCIQSIVEGVMPEPIDPVAHKAAQKTQKIYNLGKGTNNPNEAQSALKRTGPQLPGV